MMEESAVQKKTNIFGNAIIIACGMIAYFIGAGFASGQEIFQFFITYGGQFIFTLSAATFLIIWVSVSYVKSGYENDFKGVGDVFYYYGGKYIGTFFDYFNVIYCYSFFFYMDSAAATTAHIVFGLPKAFGAILLGLAVIITVIIGFDRLAKIMGFSGMFIVVIISVVMIYNIAINYQNIPEGIAYAESATSVIQRGGPANPVLGGLVYIGGVVLWFASYLSQVGARFPRKASKMGTLLGSVGAMVLVLLSVLTLFSALPEVASSDVPNLILANRLSKTAGICFSIIIIVEVYNTSAPLVWTAVSRIAPDEKSLRFKIVTIVLVGFGIIVAILVPFKTLIGIIITVGGYVCFIFFGAVILKDIRTFLTNRNKTILLEKENA